jgi:hypothetical protein
MEGRSIRQDRRDPIVGCTDQPSKGKKVHVVLKENGVTPDSRA